MDGWREWFASAEGAECAAASTLGLPPNMERYLVHRLERAFIAGASLPRAAPQSVPEGLRERLVEIAERVAFDAMNVTEQFDELAVCFAEEVGYLPPGKDSPSLLPQSDAGVDRLERRQEWERWLRHETAERNRQAREDRAWLLSLVGGG